MDTWWEAHTDETGAKILSSEQHLQLERIVKSEAGLLLVTSWIYYSNLILKWAIEIIGEVLVTLAIESLWTLL